jgi:26S proteasome regulatory subunit N5
MVDQAMTYLPDLKSNSEKNAAGKTRWLELLETLRDITEGKIHLELQRARLTRMLAGWHEELALTAPTTAPEASSGEEFPEVSIASHFFYC